MEAILSSHQFRVVFHPPLFFPSGMKPVIVQDDDISRYILKSLDRMIIITEFRDYIYGFEMVVDA